MTTKGKEVAVHSQHIHLEMRCTLGTIHQNGDAVLVGYLNNFLYRVYRAQHIADMRYADQLRAIRYVCRDGIATYQTTVVCDRQMLDDNTPFLCLQLPGDNV